MEAGMKIVTMPDLQLVEAACAPDESRLPTAITQPMPQLTGITEGRTRNSAEKNP
jgi:hypothetical protein